MKHPRLSFRAIALISAMVFVPIACVFASNADAASPATAAIAAPTCGNDAVIVLNNATTSKVKFSLLRSTASSPWDFVYVSANRTTEVHTTVAGSGETLSVQANGTTLTSKAVTRSATACASGTPAVPAMTSNQFGATVNAPACGNGAQVVLNNGLSHDIWYNFQISGKPADTITDLQAKQADIQTENITAANTNVQVVWNGQVIAQKTVSPGAPCPGATTTTTTAPTSTTVYTTNCAASDNLAAWGGCPKFDDEFSGSSVNTGANGWWIYDYPNDPSHPRVASNVSVSNGSAQLAGTWNPSTGVIQGAGLMSKFGEKYGQFEVRARLPKGAGFSGVSLLWPGAGHWPDDGEIDLYEIPKDPRTQALQIVHNGANNSQQGQWAYLDATQWHVYGVQWTPTRVSFLVDGRVKWTETNPKYIPASAPMNITLQMDPGIPCGGWYECPNASTPPSQAMSVDWVKAWGYAGG